MTPGARAPTLAAMGDAPTSVRLVVEIERHTEPIRGTVSDPAGSEHPYVGWVALIGALEDVLEVARHAQEHA